MTGQRRIRLFAALVTLFVAYAVLHQFGWGTGLLILGGFVLLAAVGWVLPVPRHGRHADPASQGWRGPTLWAGRVKRRERSAAAGSGVRSELILGCS